MLEIGKVIHIHIRDDLVDLEKMYVRTEKMGLAGRPTSGKKIPGPGSRFSRTSRAGICSG